MNEIQNKQIDIAYITLINITTWMWWVNIHFTKSVGYGLGDVLELPVWLTGIALVFIGLLGAIPSVLTYAVMGTGKILFPKDADGQGPQIALIVGIVLSALNFHVMGLTLEWRGIFLLFAPWMLEATPALLCSMPKSIGTGRTVVSVLVGIGTTILTFILWGGTPWERMAIAPYAVMAGMLIGLLCAWDYRSSD